MNLRVFNLNINYYLLIKVNIINKVGYNYFLKKYFNIKLI